MATGDPTAEATRPGTLVHLPRTAEPEPLPDPRRPDTRLDSLLSSVLFDYTGVYKQMIDDLRAGTFGKVYTMDVENGGVRLLELPEEVAQETKDAVAAAEQEIVGGGITVSAISDAEEMKAKIAELFPQ